MADQPKRSAFDPDPPKVKGVPDSQREKPTPAAPSADKDTAAKPDHEKGLIDSIKGLIENHAKGGAPGGTPQGGTQPVSTNDAVEQMSRAIRETPGNSTDYG